MGEIKQEKIVERLPSMPLMEGVNGLELEEPVAIDEHVQKVGLQKTAMGDRNRRFQDYARETSSKFAFVDQFIEKTAELVVNVEDVAHDFAG